MSRPSEVTRLEGFSDTVFGFALTLLVVSLEVPDTFEKLMLGVRGFAGFALMFAMVCWIWYEHHFFFRRFGTPDRWTVFLNSVLLFVVLFYVYPLKFLTQALMNQTGIGPGEGPSFAGATDGATLMVLYSTGVALIFGVYALLYQRAWRGRAALELSPVDTVVLRFGLRSHVFSMALGLASLALVLVLPRWAAVAGMMYGLMGPIHAWNGYLSGKAQSDLAGPPALEAAGTPGPKTGTPRAKR